MVLDEATTSSSDSFADDPYPSDNDPYSSPSSDANDPRQQGSIHIDMDDFPRPVPLIGPLVFCPRWKVAQFASERRLAASRILQRPLTEEEAKAITFHMAWAYSLSSYGAALGAAIAMRRCYTTRQSYRFPFWDPRSFKGFTPDSLGPLKGNSARIALHIMRGSSYWLLGAAIGGLCSRFWTATMASVAILGDRRLERLNETIITKRSEGLRQPADRGQSASGERSGRSSMDKATPQPSPQPEAWDEASPTGGAGPMDSESPAGESTWERIRREASGQSPSAGRGFPREQRDDATLGGSFAFSRSEEEGQLAKAEAQRQFDERVERERRGQDFEDGGKRR